MFAETQWQFSYCMLSRQVIPHTNTLGSAKEKMKKSAECRITATEKVQGIKVQGAQWVRLEDWEFILVIWESYDCGEEIVLESLGMLFQACVSSADGRVEKKERLSWMVMNDVDHILEAVEVHMVILEGGWFARWTRLRLVLSMNVCCPWQSSCHTKMWRIRKWCICGNE